MKIFVVFLFIFAMAFGGPVDDSANAHVLHYENENNGDGSYKFTYETSNGISRAEEGQLKNVGEETDAISVHGTVSWVAPDGQTYTMEYTADENGYHSKGVQISS